MSCGIYRPGGLELTRYALEQIKAVPGTALLDIGCADGAAAQCAQREFELCVTAVDIDSEAVARARATGIDARCADAAALNFPSQTFDIVLMECVLSLVNDKEEALKQISYVLRPSGYLILSDLYQKDEGAKACGEVIDLKALIDSLKRLGLESVVCEERTRDMKSFIAQAIMSYGSVDAWFEAEGGWKPSGLCRYGKGMGYFLLIVRKAGA